MPCTQKPWEQTGEGRREPGRTACDHEPRGQPGGQRKASAYKAGVQIPAGPSAENQTFSGWRVSQRSLGDSSVGKMRTMDARLGVGDREEGIVLTGVET